MFNVKENSAFIQILSKLTSVQIIINNGSFLSNPAQSNRKLRQITLSILLQSCEWNSVFSFIYLKYSHHKVDQSG